MERDRWHRLAPLTGILAVVLWVVGSIILFSDEPESGAAPDEIAAHFADNAGRLITGGFLFMLGVAAFLWFLGTLRAALARAEGGVGRVAGIVSAGGTALAAMMLAMVAPTIAGALQVQNEDRDPSPQAADALANLGDGFFVAAEVAAIVPVAATAVAILRTGVFPRWVAWVSLLLAVWLVAAPVGWLGLLLGVPAWTLLMSVMLWMRAAASPTADPEPAGAGSPAP